MRISLCKNVCLKGMQQIFFFFKSLQFYAIYHPRNFYISHHACIISTMYIYISIIYLNIYYYKLDSVVRQCCAIHNIKILNSKLRNLTFKYYKENSCPVSRG